MKIVHMGSAHSADDIRIFQKECRTLRRAGYQVVFIVQSDQDALIDGVQIRAIKRVSNRLQRFTLNEWRMLRAALREEGDVYHLHSPDLIPLGALLRLKGKKIVYDVHEDFPAEIMTKYWIPVVLRKPVSFATRIVERLAARLFDSIVAATPTIALLFPSEKTVTIRNFPQLEELEATNSVPYSARPMTAIYIGSIASVRCVREMVNAIELVSLSKASRLMLAGKFESPELEREVRALPGWSHVEFVGWKGRHEIKQLLANCRVGLVIFEPTPNHVRAEPNKLFEYMAAGLPVVASNFSYWREIIERNRAGITVDPHSPEQIASAITWLFEHPLEAEEMGRNGARAARSTYNWDCEADKLIAHYKLIAG